MQKPILDRMMVELQKRIDLNQVVCIEQIGEITYQITLKTGGAILAFDKGNRIIMHLFEEVGA